MKRYAMLLLVLIILMFTLPSNAQDTDATDEPAAATVEPTQEVIIIVTQTPAVEPTAAATEEAPVEEAPPVVPANTAGTVLLILIPILSIAFGGGGILAMVLAFRKDRGAVAASEQLGNSVPQPIAAGLQTTIDALVAGLLAGREAIDRVPAATKPAEFSNLATDAMILELERRGYSVKLPGAPAS